ncbi:MAG: glycogen synthase [Bacilli bacterium]|nr:glycogen synthase [Bacilli bacterium]
MRIVFVASEANPFIKTGGLADVVYALAAEFATLKHEVSIILPFYNKIKDNITSSLTNLGSFTVDLSWRKVEGNIFYTKFRDINYYLVDNDRYYNRREIYGENDDGERFAFLSMAAVKIMKDFDLKPDIVHVHDWQVGMIPCLIKESHDDYFSNTKSILTIHNPAFQGLFSRDYILDTYALPSYVYDDGAIRLNDQVSTLKAAIMYSDKITTVSPTHREETLTSEGRGLEYALRLREKDFIGILNGIDYNEFSPLTDYLIAANYNEDNFYEAKQKNKDDLLKKFDLSNLGLPVFGLVSRLTWQKGIDLVIPMIRTLVLKGCTFIILGSGEFELEQQFEQLRREFPFNVGIYIGYNNELAHLIYAGSDFFLMPSLFEPCGLSQMISQRYGTLPIVRKTGGLNDSVICYDNNNINTANGFGFSPNSVEEFIRTVSFAFDIYWNLPIRKKLMLNALKTDNSWVKSANEYLKVYHSALGIEEK